ncbi:hypothetical protein MASR2M117_13710 [Paludibacter sp.]
MSDTTLAITPENATLRKEYQALQSEFLDLYTQHRHMVDDESVILTSVYIKELGYLQHELFKKQTEQSRLKMKIKLIQACYNRNEMPDLQSIERQLDKELADYYEQIKKQAEDYETSLNILSNLISEEEVTQLKEIFRLLCKRLHPDLNPYQTEEEKELFIKVKAAYDLGRLSELQEILLYIDQIGADTPSTITKNSLQENIEHLRKNIQSLKEKITALEQSFPFTVKNLLSDREVLTEKQEEIKLQIKIVEEKIQQYNHQLNLMIIE